MRWDSPEITGSMTAIYRRIDYSSNDAVMGLEGIKRN
jgi:hypothetical protein